MYRFIFYLLSY